MRRKYWKSSSVLSGDYTMPMSMANDEQHGVYALQAGVFPFRRGKAPFLDNCLIFLKLVCFGAL